MPETSETLEAGKQTSAAFEAIKPDLIAFLKENLTVTVDVNGYDADYVEVTVSLCGENISSSGATI